ncbi:MAG: hypothetical protein ACXWT0_13280 [Methylobacter sp.]
MRPVETRFIASAIQFDPKSRKGATIRDAINRVSTVSWLKHLANQDI